MLNQLIKISLSLILSGNIYANIKHINGSYFDDNGVKIFYPCTGGGEPLIIYGNAASSNNLVSSKNKVEPIYIKEGFKSQNLEVSNAAQSEENSDQYLIIKSENPATSGQYVKFNLEKVNGEKFYINTVNLASVSAANENKIVTNYSVKIDNSIVVSRILPIKMYSFQQDIGVNIYKNLNNIEVQQFVWDQTIPWTDYSHPNLSSLIKLNFRAKATTENFNFNGYGYWICGN
ncbi:hypothetical protein QEJ31_06395 [Pigmentibacter sp. JX0631]|uniref:hypothetical protein n=1 Tax=Pigmentibacter sp. JX0631 TaxID=2976982 RepID=UPI0024686490|nr:hypothetical protein [Pigmentibacter sp. JX0631]WGL61219.1 hypothetical protein QEJ31_06395 [Pigmentibacter sp. JX0631]